MNLKPTFLLALLLALGGCSVHPYDCDNGYVTDFVKKDAMAIYLRGVDLMARSTLNSFLNQDFGLEVVESEYAEARRTRACVAHITGRYLQEVGTPAADESPLTVTGCQLRHPNLSEEECQAWVDEDRKDKDWLSRAPKSMPVCRLQGRSEDECMFILENPHLSPDVEPLMRVVYTVRVHNNALDGQQFRILNVTPL